MFCVAGAVVGGVLGGVYHWPKLLVVASSLPFGLLLAWKWTELTR